MSNNKHLMRQLLSAMIVTAMVSPAVAQDRIISATELPASIQEYVRSHFPDRKVLQATKDKELFSESYELTLDGNIQLEFDKKNQIRDIDGQAKLPDSVVPEKIRQYVSAHYPEQVITDWEWDDRKQQIGLDNGLDLEFTADGEFLRIDD